MLISKGNVLGMCVYIICTAVGDCIIFESPNRITLKCIVL